MLLQSPETFNLYRLESPSKAFFSFTKKRRKTLGIFQQERGPPAAVRATPEIIETPARPESQEREEREKPLFANTPTPFVPYPPAHPRTKGVGELILFFSTGKIFR
jgi:hypothetical protein